MTGTESRGQRGLVPLLLVSGVVVLVSFGLARGLWLSNLHNGLLALAFALVGAYVLFQRPGHREGRLFLCTGLVEAVLFLGRQVGHFATTGTDGRLLSCRWRWVAAAVLVVAAGCATISAVWPVEYASAGLVIGHPINPRTPRGVSDLWSVVAHPAYAGFQVLWVVAVVARWRTSAGLVRRQLAWLTAAAVVSVVALGLGLAVAGTPGPGLIAATLVPVAAGWAILHGQHAAAYSALTWLSRTNVHSRDLPGDLARALAEALRAPGATLWIGGDELHAVGVWAESDDDIGPTTLDALQDSPLCHLRPVTARGAVVGAVSVDRPLTDRLSLAEGRLLDDLTPSRHWFLTTWVSPT